MKNRFLSTVMVAVMFILVILLASTAFAQPTPYCIDTDFGDNPYVKGTATYTDSTGFTETFTDSYSTATGKLTERYCLNRKVDSKEYSCKGDSALDVCISTCRNLGDGGYNIYESGGIIYDYKDYDLKLINPQVYRSPDYNIGLQIPLVPIHFIAGEVDESSLPRLNGQRQYAIIINDTIEDFGLFDMSLDPTIRNHIASKQGANLLQVNRIFYNGTITNETKSIRHLEYLFGRLGNFYAYPGHSGGVPLHPTLTRATFDENIFPSNNNTYIVSNVERSLPLQTGNFILDYYDPRFSTLYESYCNAEGTKKENQDLISCQDVTRGWTTFPEGWWDSVCSAGPEKDSLSCATIGGDWGNFDNNIDTILDNCCGSLRQDVGLIFTDPVSGDNNLCTLGPNGDHSFQNALLNSAKIYRADRSENTPNNLFNSLNTAIKDDYDVLANNQGEWIVCDIDGNLENTEYSQGRNFEMIGSSYCVGNSGPRCLTYPRSASSRSEFICYLNGEREEISECALTNSPNSNSYSLGQSIPSPFSETYSEFSRPNTQSCQANSQYCTTFVNPGSDILYLKNQLKVSDWSGFDNLEFEVSLQSGGLEDVEYSLEGSSIIRGNLNEVSLVSVDVSGTVWHRISIDINGVNKETISGFNLTPTSAVGEIRLQNFHFSGGNSFVCADQTDTVGVKGEWVQDLDSATTQHSCNSNFLKWSGTKCCGDDTSSAPSYSSGEFYNDVDGVCFNSKFIAKNTLTPIDIINRLNFSEKSPRILSNGTHLFGCNLNQGYSWPLTIQETDNSGNFANSNLNIINANACDIKTVGDDSYFCSPNGWNNENYITRKGDFVNSSERNILSTVQNPAQHIGTQQQCCGLGTCWDGTDCILPPDPVTGQGTALICNSDGNWDTGTINYDWLVDESDFCSSATDCLLDTDIVSPSTSSMISQEKSRCKPSGWYSRTTTIDRVSKTHASTYDSTRDLYCEQGKWSSRTSFIAEKLLTLKDSLPTDEFTLVCGPREEVLVNDRNKKAYDTGFWGPGAGFTNTYDNKFFNNLCVLNYFEGSGNTRKNTVVIGTSFNEFGDDAGAVSDIDLEDALGEAFNIDTIDLSSCSDSATVHDFKYCNNVYDSSKRGFFATRSNFYWNNMTQSLIYFPDAGNLLSTNSFGDRMYDIFVAPIRNIFASLPKNKNIDPGPLLNSTQYSSVYISVAGDKKITTLVEPKKDSNVIKEFVTVKYHNITGDVCGSVSLIDSQTNPKIICTVAGEVTTVFATVGSHTPAISRAPLEFVEKISRSTRLIK
jgi:hypothetical protein